MKKNLTELVFILDRSGSMSGLENDTIGGFNAMLEKQKAEDGEAKEEKKNASVINNSALRHNCAVKHKYSNNNQDT